MHINDCSALDCISGQVWFCRMEQSKAPGPPAALRVNVCAGIKKRIELGRAEPIEKALAAWRKAISEGLDSPAPVELRELVWDKLASHLSTKEGSTIYLCPDGELSALR